MKGLTFIEIFIAMGIATVAGVLLLVIIVNSLGLFANQSSRVESGLNINDALGQVRSAIKQSTVVDSSSGVGKLVLKVSSVDSSNNIISDIYDTYTFFLDNSVLHFQILPDALSSRQASDRIFSTNVDSLFFKYLNSANPPEEITPTAAAKIRVTLTLKQKVGTNYQINTATTEANLRND